MKIPSEEHVIVLLPKGHDLDVGTIGSEVARLVSDRQVVILDPGEEPHERTQDAAPTRDGADERGLPLVAIGIPVGIHAGKKAVDGIAAVVSDLYQDSRRPPEYR